VVSVQSCNEEDVSRLADALNIPPLIARILCVRGVTSPEDVDAFLFPKLERLSDPLLLPDMEKGIARVIEALRRKERIGLFGDYDADGVTSTALMVNFLRQVGHDPEVQLPTREEGYGINRRAIEEFREKGVTLLICLDCGSSNGEEVAIARELGLETIVIDHHELSGIRPDAVALINPKRPDSRFPMRELAACGVTFFFLLALRKALHGEGLLQRAINLKRELDLVALGTVADMVPITGDNRLLVKFGVEMMRQKPRAWLKSFLKRNIIRKGILDEYALSFGIIPRINAAGRVSNPRIALDLLITEAEDLSDELLTKLNEANRKRQEIEEGILKDAVEQCEVQGLANGHSLVVFNEDWPVGVLGIVAQRLVETYKKPAVVITRTDKAWKGSARGIQGLDLHQAIASVSPLLLSFGGHKYACGLSIAGENLLALREAFDRQVRESVQDAADTTKEVRVDAVVTYEDLTREVVETLEMLAPFGVGNPRPSFLLPTSNVSVNGGFARVTDDKKRTWYGMVIRGTSLPGEPAVRLIASPMIREEMGDKFVHLLIREWLPAE
jgi:single-stranded-DNA-specific exonuclease